MNRISLAENTSVRWLASVLFVLTTFMISIPPAQAANPLSVCSDGRPWVWPNGGRQIEFNLDRGSLGLLSEQEARAAFRAAFGVWEAVDTSTVSFVEGPELSIDVDGSNWAGFVWNRPPTLSPIIFDHTGEIIDDLFGPGSGVAGFARIEWGDRESCEVIGGYIIVNGVSFATMVHEIGHFSGLGHSTVNAQVIQGDTTGPFPADTFGRPGAQDENVATMEPTNYFPNGGAGDKATLHADDIASISSLYPTPEFSNTTATIEGSVFASNGVSRVSGVNVIARNVADPFIDSHSALSGNRTRSASQSDPFVGTYRMEGLTPGAEYALYIDEIFVGGFNTPKLSPLPGLEELFNGKRESADPHRDDPAQYTPVVTAAGDVSKDIDIIFNREPGGIVPLGLDDSIEIFLPFTFELCEQEFGTVFVNSSGNLSFGSGRVDYTPSALEFILQQPRIAPLWADLDPEGGTVRFEADKNSFTLFFEDVPEYESIRTNTFSVTLERAPARVLFNYGTITAQRVITGVSCGGVAASGSEPAVDFSALVPAAIRLHDPAVYESFSISNQFDLEGTEVTIMTKTNYSDRWAGPNDTADHAKKVALPFDSSDIKRYTAISGKGDVDWYSFTATAGTTLIAEALTGSLLVSSEDLDTVFGLYDAATMTELAVDDDSGVGFLSKIVYPILETGEYLLAVSTYPDFDFIGEGMDEGRYVLDLHTIDGLVVPVPPTEDGATEISIGFPFPFQGESWSSVWINANGSLTFGEADEDWTESATEFLDGISRIAPLWLDLSPNRGGLVYYVPNPSSLVVEFQNVPEYGGIGSNTFRVILNSDGSVEFQYDSLSATTGLVGITEGGGVLASSSDLSSSGNFSAVGTTFELFDGSNPFDLEGRVITFAPY